MIMENLIFKPITSENLPTMAEFCSEAFDTQRGLVSDELFVNGGMGTALEEIIQEPEMEAWAVYDGERPVGGAVIRVGADQCNELELFFFDASQLGHGYGTKAWVALEKQYPDTKVWMTITPLHVTRNLVFYVNHCGFHITKIITDEGPEPICVFEKRMA